MARDVGCKRRSATKMIGALIACVAAATAVPFGAHADWTATVTPASGGQQLAPVLVSARQDCRGLKPTGRDKIGSPYVINGVRYVPRRQPGYDATGEASFYGDGFHGRPTANGETYDQLSMTAAHPTLPMPSFVRVENLANGREVILRVNNRGPFKRGRIIDVSVQAAKRLGFHHRGLTRVRVQVVSRAEARRLTGCPQI